MKYILYALLCISLVSMKNFQNNLDLSSDTELVENFDVEPSEDLSAEYIFEVENSKVQQREKIAHTCKFISCFEIDVQNPPPKQ